MSKDEDFKLLKIQTVNLKVNLHCNGCKQNVKKILQRIEGVYTVTIDSDNQKVTVSGNVDSATLIKKLAKSGKHSELWNQKSINSTNNQNHKPINNPQPIKDSPSKNNNGNNNKAQTAQPLMQGLKAFKNQQSKLISLSSDEEFCEEDDEEEEEEGDLNFLGHKLNLLKQANAKKNGKNEAGPNQNNGGMMKNLNCSDMNGIMGFRGPQGASNGFPSSVTNFNGIHGNPSSMLMNENRYMNPQVMYNRSSQIPPYTGYYYPYPSYYNINNYGNNTSQPLEDYGAFHCGNGEEKSSCAVM